MFYQVTENPEFIYCYSKTYLGFPGGSVTKNPPANAGDSGWIPGSEDPLEEEMTTYFSILAWKISWTEETVGLESTGLQKLDTTK